MQKYSPSYYYGRIKTKISFVVEKFNLKTMINIIFNNNKIWVFFTDLLSSYFVLSENIYFFNIYKDNNIKTRGGGHFFKFPKSLDMLVEDKGSLA